MMATFIRGEPQLLQENWLSGVGRIDGFTMPQCEDIYTIKSHSIFTEMYVIFGTVFALNLGLLLDTQEVTLHIQ